MGRKKQETNVCLTVEAIVNPDVRELVLAVLGFKETLDKRMQAIGINSWDRAQILSVYNGCIESIVSKVVNVEFVKNNAVKILKAAVKKEMKK